MNPMDDNELMTQIRVLARNLSSPVTDVILFGSRARGDARPDSDWDLLILINKDHLVPDDFSRYAYPFMLLGFDHNMMVNPLIYTKNDWERRSFTPLYKTIQEEGIRLCR